MKLDDQKLRELGLAVIQVETQAIAALADQINDDFVVACKLMFSCKGRIVVTGMGKSGHIGRKIAATLASTGTPAFFVHSGEASHGDIGRIMRGGAALARIATVHLDIGVPAEARPLNWAPTASTTAALAVGDALAVALLKARGFTEEDFARSHPAGSLGRRLLLHVKDVMRTGADIPTVLADTPLAEGLMEVTRKGLGMTAIVDETMRVLGVFTDGDLRRALDASVDLRATRMD